MDKMHVNAKAMLTLAVLEWMGLLVKNSVV